MTTAVEPAPAPPVADTEAAARLADGVRRLRIGSFHLGERILMVAGFVAVGLGLLFVGLGWYGAAHTPNLYEQIPYVASGGLFGLGLIFLGGFFYFAHWLTELVKEHRAQSSALLEAITRLDDAVRHRPAATGIDAAAHNSGGQPAERGERAERGDTADSTAGRPLVATARGTMAHRPDCVVTAGKRGLRTVSSDDGLEGCKLCDPYGES